MKQKLTPMQARFVRLYCQLGNAVEAARQAGYAEKTAADKSWSMIRRPAMLEAIRIETQACLDAGVALGKKVLVDLATNAASEAVRLQAGLALLDRGGLRLKNLSEHQHVHTLVDGRSDAELKQRIADLSREMGIPVNSRLIEQARPALPALPMRDLDVVDAELVEHDAGIFG